MAAIKRLEQMKLIPILNLQEIEGMKKGIPDINMYSESTGERPFPRINNDIWTTLPSDSEIEWKIEELNKEFKKLMGRP